MFNSRWNESIIDELTDDFGWWWTAEKKKVVCYFGSWSVYRYGDGKFDVEDINPFICTHLIFTFAGLDPIDNVIVSLDPYNDIYDNWGLGAYERFVALKRLNPELKTILAIGGWNEGSEKYSKVKQNFLKNN